jgi:predicted MFS family arabinose efflux permease
MLMTISVFGGFLLLPLYLQTVRAESALDSGLLLAPQGLGAMLAMPIAGRLTDRTGIGRIVPFGLLGILASFVVLTQLDAHTSYWLFGVDLFVMGVGMGFTMMPTFSGAVQTLRRASIARASTALNIIQQVGSSIGTAVLSIVLTNQIRDHLPPAAGHAGGGIGAAVPKAIVNPVAAAFGETFWWATVLVIAAFLVAAVLLPRQRPEPPEDDDAELEATPLLVH